MAEILLRGNDNRKVPGGKLWVSEANPALLSYVDCDSRRLYQFRHKPLWRPSGPVAQKNQQFVATVMRKFLP